MGSIEMRGSFNFGELTTRVRAAIPAALQRAGEHIGEVSAQQVPIEEGTLLRSQKIDVDAEKLEVAISYHTPYARYQHEKMELRHEHGNAKFLELPLMSEGHTAVEMVGADVKRAM